MFVCRGLWFGLFGFALIAPPLAQGQSTAEQQVAKLVARYDSSWNRKDTAAVSRLLAPRYQYFTSRGDMSSRARVMEMLGSPDYVLERAERSEVVVSQSGVAAVVSSRWQGQGTYKGSRFTDDQRCGLVWIQTGTTWQVVSEHCVQIAPKPPAPSN